MSFSETLENCPLGKEMPYRTTYMPSLLFPISRQRAWGEMQLSMPPPFDGVDLWYAYELSWLNPKGKPLVAIAEIRLPCSTANLIESKSLKIYLHSFNQTVFESVDEVQRTMKEDLSQVSGGQVEVKVMMPKEFAKFSLAEFEGICLDDLDVSTSTYTIDASLLKTGSEMVEEKLYSHLLKSNCLVTSQPDWGHVFIHYQGRQIDHASLLKYIISFRNHNGFHEQCIERIFVDIMEYCRPEKLTVYGRYTRRGGLDINPFRSNWQKAPNHYARLYRQ